MTVASTVYDVIKLPADGGNWGNGGYGGDDPTIQNTETQRGHDPLNTDVIEVRHYTLRKREEPVNDVFVNKFYTIDIYVRSRTTAAQLTLLTNEVEYLLRNTSMTDLQLVDIEQVPDMVLWDLSQHSVILKVELVSLMSSGAITPASSTGYNWHEAMMITSTYAAWVPMTFQNATNNAKIFATYSTITNVDGTDVRLSYHLPLPPSLGTLKLYVSGLRVGLEDADASDYLSSAVVRGMVYNTSTVILADYTDYTSPARVGYSWTAHDCSGYDVVFAQIELSTTTQSEIDIAFVTMQCYYDT